MTTRAFKFKTMQEAGPPTGPILAGYGGYIYYAGLFATVGGDATETIAVRGVRATDVVIACVQKVGNTPRVLVTAKCTKDTVTLVFADDPSSDHIINVLVIKKAPPIQATRRVY